MHLADRRSEPTLVLAAQVRPALREARARDRVVPPGTAGPAEGGVGTLVVADDDRRLGGLLEDGRDERVADRVEPLARDGGALEVAQHLSGGVRLARDVRGESPVAPRPLPVLGHGEVQRQHRGGVVEPAMRCLDGEARAAVQVLARPERQALVRRLLKERVAEAQPSGAVVGEEVAEGHLRPVEARVPGERPQQRPVRLAAEHGRDENDAPRVARQEVDLAHRDGVERVRQRADGTLVQQPQQLLDEQRVAGGLLDDRVSVLGTQRRGIRRRVHELGHRGVGERAEHDAPVGSDRHEARVGRTTRDAEEPRPIARRGREARGELPGGRVEPVRVLDDDEERPGSHRPEHARRARRAVRATTKRSASALVSGVSSSSAPTMGASRGASGTSSGAAPRTASSTWRPASAGSSDVTPSTSRTAARKGR